MITWIRIKWEMLERMFFWGWKMRHSYDFDCNYIHDMVYYKLDRCYKVFRDHGHLTWSDNINSKGMRKLRVARNLAKRITEDDYLIGALKLHKAKWGESHSHFTPRGKHSSTRLVTYEKAYGYDENKKADDEKYKLYKKARTQKQQEHEMLFKYLGKYLNYWWD